MSRPEWFRPTRFGYGTFLPIAWQGWMLTAAVIALVVILAVELSDQPLAMIASLAAVVATFLVILARSTRGGWRWRWGDKD